VEKRQDYAVKAKELKDELKTYLGISGIDSIRILIRYDMENISDEIYKKALVNVFSEPPVDNYYEEKIELAKEDRVFTVEYMPGQFDQRADSAVQCIKLLESDVEVLVKNATTYIVSGNISDVEFEQIKAYCVNPVDSRIAEEEKPDNLFAEFETPADVEYLKDFYTMSLDDFKNLYKSLSLAMNYADFLYIREYFEKEEKRDPSITEIRVLDTYWSDHCRHTTFLTELKQIEFEDGFYADAIKESYKEYLKDREEVFEKPEERAVSLMDLALMAMRKLKKEGLLKELEESEEINACSIVVPAYVDGVKEEWLINFKNETHNHPTEIEPFGGAATCLGGAIRDPLSGRTYVYQGMRITGAADPRKQIEETIKGKLPQRKIVTTAASGYSSYGNQIGLATGYVKEIYHPSYVAKRMEIGAVIAANKKENVIKCSPSVRDSIILLGGRTGRDGCGGATGSSKAHTGESMSECGAEVQKGNAPTERKIQRLFRRKEVSLLIKKCNDFGAGGVSVAIGELAEGLSIDLDKVPKKYAGLDGTEIAISESQERMAVVISPENVEKFLAYAKEENLEAVEVAKVESEKRLVMSWRGKNIVDISRAFLDTNGARQEADVCVCMPDKDSNIFVKPEVADIKKTWLEMLKDLNSSSQKGLVEMFDSTVGGKSVYMPYGGKYMLSETQSMVAKLPLVDKDSDFVTIMSYGFDPYMAQWSPYHSAAYAVLDSVAKVVAAGGDYSKIYLSFQEYFKKLSMEAKRWGEPFAALLGAYSAQKGLSLAAIGGKDSMSGSFNDLDVVPTLVSFAVATGSVDDIISPELKNKGSKLILIDISKDKYDMPDYADVKETYAKVHDDIKNKRIISAYALNRFGIAQAVSYMAFGNKLGVRLEHNLDERELFAPRFGSLIAEVKEGELGKLNCSYTVIGEVNKEGFIEYADTKIDLEEAIAAWQETLEPVFPSSAKEIADKKIEVKLFEAPTVHICDKKCVKPQVIIPVMPGTNCEDDAERAFVRAGASVSSMVFRNSSPEDVRESVKELAEAISKSNILMLPGGFSAGDEPDGSAKFFATVFRNELIKREVEKLLKDRDGLVLGICNGFQTLIKLGLITDGVIKDQDEHSPTLTMNSIGKHISTMGYIKVMSNLSPWLRKAELGSVYANPASHGEGRFVAQSKDIEKFIANGQIATMYADLDLSPNIGDNYNFNGSYMAVEGMSSPDGKVFGKMLHSERIGRGVSINIYGEQDMKIFESGVEYFTA
jgi:phosphoribosylformylglycinamidine synthase